MTPDAFVKETLSRHLYAVEGEKFFRRRKAELAEDWPDWCGLPMAAVQAILDSRGLTPIEQAAEMAPLTAALLWRRSKIIYRFDPALRDALAAQHAHASPVPHIRRAHWHHFWAGARDSADRHLILRWIPPVPVAMPEDTEQRTVIRPVK